MCCGTEWNAFSMLAGPWDGLLNGIGSDAINEPGTTYTAQYAWATCNNVGLYAQSKHWVENKTRIELICPMGQFIHVLYSNRQLATKRKKKKCHSILILIEFPCSLALPFGLCAVMHKHHRTRFAFFLCRCCSIGAKSFDWIQWI